MELIQTHAELEAKLAKAIAHAQLAQSYATNAKNDVEEARRLRSTGMEEVTVTIQNLESKMKTKPPVP